MVNNFYKSCPFCGSKGISKNNNKYLCDECEEYIDINDPTKIINNLSKDEKDVLLSICYAYENDIPFFLKDIELYGDVFKYAYQTLENRDFIEKFEFVQKLGIIVNRLIAFRPSLIGVKTYIFLSKKPLLSKEQEKTLNKKIKFDEKRLIKMFGNKNVKNELKWNPINNSFVISFYIREEFDRLWEKECERSYIFKDDNFFQI